MANSVFLLIKFYLVSNTKKIMNTKLLCVLLASSLAFIALPALSLPGNGMINSLRRVQGSSFAQGMRFSEVISGTETVGYHGRRSFNAFEVEINFHSEDIFNRFHREGFEANNTVYFDIMGIEGSIRTHESNRAERWRQSRQLLSLITEIWGSEIANDFKESTFTDRYSEYGRGELPTASDAEAAGDVAFYKGRKYGYVAFWREPSWAHRTNVGFYIYELRDWENNRRMIPNERRF
jgi:hypothetical protein